MKMDPPGPHSLRKSPQSSSEEASNSADSSLMPPVLHPEVNYSCLQMSATEMLHTEAASSCPSSMDLPLQDSPDSSTNPKLKWSSPEADEGPEKKGEKKVLARKQKMWIVFSQAQLCALNRFQRQRYLSFQQMQEPSTILNLSCKQIKTWFQNQRRKYKQWQKNQCLKTSNGLTQKGSTPMEYPSIHCSYPQGYLVNASGSLPMWGNKTWTNTTWNNQTWIYPT